MSEKRISIGSTRQLIDINEDKRAFNLDISVQADDPTAVFKGLIITQSDLDSGSTPAYRQFTGGMKAKIKNDGKNFQSHYLDLISESESPVPCTVKIIESGTELPPRPAQPQHPNSTPLGLDGDVVQPESPKQPVPKQQPPMRMKQQINPNQMSPNQMHSPYPFTSSRREVVQPPLEEDDTKIVKKGSFFTLKNFLIIAVVAVIICGLYFIWMRPSSKKNTNLPPVPTTGTESTSSVTPGVETTTPTPSAAKTVEPAAPAPAPAAAPAAAAAASEKPPSTSPTKQSLETLMKELQNLAE